MLSKTIYTGEYIKKLHDETGNDPALLERVIFAFGLLEAIKKVGLPFCFKGGTALLLLLEQPKRLSTDIDIIVEPGTDIDEYIRRAGEIFPFIKVEENVRAAKNNISKRHFRFNYLSPGSGRDVMILLDVLFEKVHYGKTIVKPIKNKFLLTEGEDLFVTMPDVNGILGDKLTAFAPHTTGIPFGVAKELEIIKQMFDCASLFDAMTDYSEVKSVYESCVKSEAKYRNLAVSTDDVLKDTIQSCFCIASRGMCENNDYLYFKDGISRIRNHIVGAIIRNISEFTGLFALNMRGIDRFGELCLYMFLGIAMITLKIWQLVGLALPLIILLTGQTLFMFLFTRFLVFRAMGRNYDAAVISAGMCGFGMGAMPNAMANMQAICGRYAHSAKAYLLIPVVGSIFADFFNSLIITFFINVLK